MTDQEKVDKILEAMREEVSAFVKDQDKITSATAYEDQVLAISRKFAAGLIQHSGAPLPKSRNSKKSPDDGGAPRT